MQPDLGDGLRARSVGDEQEAARSYHRHLVALLAGRRPPLQLSWRGCRRHARTGLPGARLSAVEKTDAICASENFVAFIETLVPPSGIIGGKFQLKAVRTCGGFLCL